MNKQEAIKELEELIDGSDWSSIKAIMSNDGEDFAGYADNDGITLLKEVVEGLGQLVDEAEERARSVTELLTIAECTDLRIRARTIHGDNEVVVDEDADVDTTPEDGCWVEAKLWVPKED